MSLLLPSEQDLLDRLLGAALQDMSLQIRLFRHDSSLQCEYCIPCYTWRRLMLIQAQSLEEFCRQLYALAPHEA